MAIWLYSYGMVWLSMAFLATWLWHGWVYLAVWLYVFLWHNGYLAVCLHSYGMVWLYMALYGYMAMA